MHSQCLPKTVDDTRPLPEAADVYVKGLASPAMLDNVNASTLKLATAESMCGC